jgi:hypothetical protein
MQVGSDDHPILWCQAAKAGGKRGVMFDSSQCVHAQWDADNGKWVCRKCKQVNGVHVHDPGHIAATAVVDRVVHVVAKLNAAAGWASGLWDGYKLHTHYAPQWVEAMPPSAPMHGSM